METINLTPNRAAVLQCQLMKSYYKASTGLTVFFKKLYMSKDNYIMEKIEITDDLVQTLTCATLPSSGENARTRVWRFAESELDKKIYDNIGKDFNVLYVDELYGRE